MSAFCVKAIALLIMTLDHIGLVYGRGGWDQIPFPSSYLRAIGRIAFPCFAFCMAQGWHRTKSRKNYFLNLVFGAAASQIPFNMAFYTPNLTKITSNRFCFQVSENYIFFAVVAIWIYWRFILQKQWELSILPVGIAALIPGFKVEIYGFWILCQSTNVFYTFLMAFLCLYIFEYRYDFDARQRMVLCIAASVLLVAYGLPADYGTGLLGIVLIVGFAILSEKTQQIGFLVLWSLLYYGLLVGNIWSALFCTASAIVILLYDPKAKSRIRAKKLFYWYYPAHLLMLGISNIRMKY